MAISNAPLVILTSFHQHNSGTVAKHGRHIKYIATRPGVDRGAARDDLSPENIPVEAHTEYIAERPGFCGLFGYREISDHKEIQKELAGHKGLSWRFVVSLRADDATKMGYDNREKWEETLKSQINTVGEKMGISRDNLRWCAAFHVHPQQVNCHAHIVVWQKDVVRTTGKLNAQEMCKTAAVAADITKQEAGWTAFTMCASLKMLGVEQSERQNITNDFVSRNNIKADTKAIFEKIDKTDDVNPAAGNATKYLQKTTWQRLASNLNTADSPYPWATKENPYHLDQAKMQKTIKKIKQADMANVPADKMQQIITQYTQLLVAARLPEPEIKKEIKAFTEKAGHTINIEQTYERAIKIDPIENMQRLAGSKDDVQDFLNKYAKALTAMGREPEEVKQLITAWDERSSSNIDELKVDKAVKKAVDEKAEAKEWNTQYFLGKQTWQDLTDRLGIKANWVWKRTRGPNILNIIWRSCWRAVQNERMQCEAQAEQQKLRQAQKESAKQKLQKLKNYSRQDREGGREQER